jgi:hypothetical protein
MTAKKLADLPSEELREQSLNALTVLCHFCWHQYHAGQKEKLLEVIGMSFIHGVPPPQWAREAFVEAYQSTPNSWDNVFGPPVPKGKSAKAARRERASGPRVITAATRIRKQGTKFPEAFDEAAKSPELSEYGLSGAKVREIYYGSMRQVRKNSPAVLGARCWEDALAISLILQLADLQRTFQKAGLDFKKELFGPQVTEVT